MKSLGLTSEVARARLATHGANSLPSEKEKSFLNVAFAVLREPMLLLLVAAGAISFLLAELVDALLLMATVFIVLGISIYQERRTERALSALRVAVSSIRIVDQTLGLVISSAAIIGAGQVAFFREFENLSYAISLGYLVIAIWLYTKIGSWALAGGAMIALGAGAAEFVIATMDNSIGAIIGMLLVGGIVTTIAIRAAGTKTST